MDSANPSGKKLEHLGSFKNAEEVVRAFGQCANELGKTSLNFTNALQLDEKDEVADGEEEVEAILAFHVEVQALQFMPCTIEHLHTYACGHAHTTYAGTLHVRMHARTHAFTYACTQHSCTCKQ